MRHSRLTWLAGLVVAAGAAVLTAHGLIEVALGSRVPRAFGWLYPVITDGLALVAYAATTQLAGRGRAYAWSVVVLAAGLSGLAQATYLAGPDPATVAAVAVSGSAPTGLRFGVGAWPAIAAAIAAHLLYLIGRSGRAVEADAVSAAGSGAVSGAEPVHAAVADSDRPEIAPRELPAREQRQLEPIAAPAVSDDRVVQPEGVQAVRTDDVQPDLDADRQPRGGVLRTALSPRDRAFALAQLYRRRLGSLPSVRELASQAQVSQGTAAKVLRELRAQPPELHLINNESSTTTGTRTNP